MAYEKVTLYGVPIVAAPQGRLRPDRPGAVPRAVHPARAGRGRLGDPPPVLRRQPRSCSTRSRSWSTGPGAATSWSTTRPCSSFYDAADPGRRGLRPALRRLVEEGPPRPTRTCSPSPASCWSTPAATRVDPDDYPDAWLADGVAAAADLPVRAGRRRRRRHRATCRCRCSTRLDAGRLRLAGAGPARGAGDRADPVAAQAAAPQLRAGAGLGRARCSTGSPARRGSLLDAVGGELRRLTGTIVPRDAWRPGPGARTTCGSPSGWSTSDGDALGRGQGPGRAAARSWRPKVQRDDLGRAPATSSAAACTARRLRHAAPRASSRSAAATRSPPTRRWSTRATASAVRVFETEAEQRRGDARRHPPAAAARPCRRPPRYLQGRLDNQAKLALCRQPAPRRRRPARRLRRRGRRQAGRRRRRAGLGRRRVRRAARRRSAPTWSTRWPTWSTQVAARCWPPRTRSSSGSAAPATRALVPALADIRQQLTGLVHPGFVTETGWRQLHRPAPLPARRSRTGWTGCAGTLARDRQLMAPDRTRSSRSTASCAPSCRRAARPTRGCGRSAG